MNGLLGGRRTRWAIGELCPGIPQVPVNKLPDHLGALADASNLAEFIPFVAEAHDAVGRVSLLGFADHGRNVTCCICIGSTERVDVHMHDAIACICTMQLAEPLRTLMTGTDRVEFLGAVTDWLGNPCEVFREGSCLDLRALDWMAPAGVAELQQRIDSYWNALAAYRLRTADLSGIDLDEAGNALAQLPGCGGAGGLEHVDWVEVGKRLASLKPYGGFAEIHKLHALLTGTETPKEA